MISQNLLLFITTFLKENFISIIVLFSLTLILVLFFTLHFHKKTKKYLHTLAFFDEVTNHSNFQKFKLDVEQCLKNNPDKKFSIISFDVDNFKYINNILGYERGNNFLRQFASILHKELSPGAIFCRYDADIFCIFTRRYEEFEINEKIFKMNTIQKLLRDELQFEVTFSLGIYNVDDKNIPVQQMVDYANIARKSQKGMSYNNTYSYYTKKMNSSVHLHNHILSTMSRALKNGDFQLFIQPKYCATHNRFYGGEALTRWTTEDTTISPEDFITLFEKNGFIKELDKYTFEEVCKFLHDWNIKYDFPLIISCNISPLMLQDSNLPYTLHKITEEYSVPTSQIEIEITERIMTKDINSAIIILHRFKSYGFRLSIDDFGAGFNSLNLLKDIPADIIKLDKEFLSNLFINSKGKIILSSIIEMAKKLNIEVLAEGVETLEEIELLKKIDCSLFQGYYYSKPLSLPEFSKFIQQKHLL